MPSKRIFTVIWMHLIKKCTKLEPVSILKKCTIIGPDFTLKSVQNLFYFPPLKVYRFQCQPLTLFLFNNHQEFFLWKCMEFGLRTPPAGCRSIKNSFLGSGPGVINYRSSYKRARSVNPLKSSSPTDRQSSNNRKYAKKIEIEFPNFDFRFSVQNFLIFGP